MPKKIVFIIFITLVFTSCSSTKETPKNNQLKVQESKIDTSSNTKILHLKKGLINFEYKGEAIININNEEFSGTFELGYLDDIHSIINIYGPFGIHMVSIEIKSDTIKIANLWHKRYYQTHLTINSPELKLSLLKLFRKIVLAEPLIDTVVVTQLIDTLYFKNTFENAEISYTYNLSDNNLIYTNLIINEYIIDLKYNKLSKIELNSYPHNINLEVKNLNAKVLLEIDKIVELKDLNKYKPIDYNKLQKVDDINNLAK